MMPASLSIVIPAFNAEPYIRDCLRSVVADVVSGTEILVVDDGSTDRTAEIVTREFPSARLLAKKNGGPGSARNFGVEHAKGQVVLFVDADDAMVPGRLAAQGAFMLKHPEVAMSYGSQFVGRVSPSWTIGAHSAESDFAVVDDAWERLLVEGNFVPNSTCSVRRAIYFSIGGQRTDVRIGEDYGMHLAIARQWPIAATRRPLAWYRLSTGANLMSSPRTYRDPVLVVRDELMNFGSQLRPHARKKALARWNKAADSLLRWRWIEDGRKGVVNDIEQLSPLLWASLSIKWRLASFLPRSIGRLARSLNRCWRPAANT